MDLSETDQYYANYYDNYDFYDSYDWVRIRDSHNRTCIQTEDGEMQLDGFDVKECKGEVMHAPLPYLSLSPPLLPLSQSVLGHLAETHLNDRLLDDRYNN